MNIKWFSWFVVVLVLLGCGGGQIAEDKAEKAELPEGHPPVGGGGVEAPGSMLGSDAPTDDDPLPLKLEGLNSLQELEEGMKGTADEEAREAFASGYRKTFTADAARRDYPGAEKDLLRAIERDPGFAEAYRALGYARFNMGFDIQGALDAYRKAVELDPDYGEAHYALAFMYAMSDLESGAEHFERAMELGVVDERNLGSRYYSGK